MENKTTGSTTPAEAKKLLLKVTDNSKQQEVKEECNCESICNVCLRREIRKYQYIAISELEKLGWEVKK